MTRLSQQPEYWTLLGVVLAVAATTSGADAPAYLAGLAVVTAAVLGVSRWRGGEKTEAPV